MGRTGNPRVNNKQNVEPLFPTVKILWFFSFFATNECYRPRTVFASVFDSWLCLSSSPDQRQFSLCPLLKVANINGRPKQSQILSTSTPSQSRITALHLPAVPRKFEKSTKGRWWAGMRNTCPSHRRWYGSFTLVRGQIPTQQRTARLLISHSKFWLGQYFGDLGGRVKKSPASAALRAQTILL